MLGPIQYYLQVTVLKHLCGFGKLMQGTHWLMVRVHLYYFDSNLKAEQLNDAGKVNI